MKITKYIKKELSNWNIFEIISLIAVLFIIFFNAYLNNDSLIAVASASCGILYTVFAGKGKISCYFFGIIGSIFYIYLAFKNYLLGNLFLNLGYYLPMQIIGIFHWKSNLRADTYEIKKTHLQNKERIFVMSFIIIGIIILDIVLSTLGGKNHILDSLTTIFSIAGMYLTVKRCIEQWFLWFAVNLLEIIIWTKVLYAGEKVYATIIMWTFYLVLSIYFYLCWYKELKSACK